MSSYLEDLEPGRLSDENSLRDGKENIINASSKFCLKNLLPIFNVFREKFDVSLALLSGTVTTVPRNTVECYKHEH
jgi:hypothetical protein